MHNHFISIVSAACLCAVACVGQTAPEFLTEEDGLQVSRGPRSVLLKRASAQLRSGEIENAIRTLRQESGSPPDPEVLKLLAVAYYMARQHRLFVRTMMEAQQAAPGDFAPYYYLGRYYDSNVNDFSKAAEFFRQAIQRKPDDFRSHYYLGYCYEAARDRERAEQEYRRAIKLSQKSGSHFALPYQGISRLRLLDGKPEAAQEFAEQAVRHGPRNPESHRLLGKVWTQLGKTDEAAHEWARVVELEPADSATWYLLYRARMALGDSTGATIALAQYRRMSEIYGAR